MTILIIALRNKRTDSITNSGHILMRILNCLNGFSIKRTCHYDKRFMPALSRLFAKAFIKIKKLSKTCAGTYIHNPRIINRTFFCKTIRTVILKLVGQIAARHINDFAPQIFNDILYEHTVFIML